MIKKTYILKEYPDTPKGYGQMYPPAEQDKWDKILEVCNANGTRYLKHIVSQEWVENPDVEQYVPECNPTLSIPMGTTQYHITIYMQGT